jgi:hypothetical protein
MRALAIVVMTGCWTGPVREPDALAPPRPAPRAPRKRLVLRPVPQVDPADEMSPSLFVANTVPDFVFDVDLELVRPVRDAYLTVPRMGQQWDTAVGTGPMPAVGEFPGDAGDRTWHLGIQEHGRWLNDRDGSLIAPIAPGRHRLRLFADRSGPYTEFLLTLVLDDGSLATASTTMP